MTSMKGWLQPVGPGRPPRLTAEQKLMTLGAVRVVMSRTEWPDALCDGVAGIIAGALEAYPTDRSCYSCDYESGGCCRNNGHDEIPLPFRQLGCDSWKGEGAPF